MNSRRRSHLDARNVATALATAMPQPLALAWRQHPAGNLDIVGPHLERDQLREVEAALLATVDTLNGVPRPIVVGGVQWTATAAAPVATSPAPHRVFIALPDEFDDATVASMVGSVGAAMDAVLAQQWWRSLADGVPDIVLLLGLDGRIVFVSESVQDVLGHHPDTLVGRDVTELVSPDHLDELRSAIDRRLDATDSALSPPDVPLRARVRHANGSWRWLETVTADRLADPVVQGVILTCRDVTGLVEAQDLIEIEQERMGFILDNSADIIAVFRSDGTAEYITPSVERVLGWTVEEILNSSAFDLLYPDDLHQVVSSLDSTITTPGERRTGRFRFKRRDGSWAWMEARAMVAPGRADVAVVSARDVSQEVEAMERAEAEEGRYRSLVERSPQGIAIHQDGRFVYLNPAAATLLGAERPSELIGRPVSQFSNANAAMVAERATALERGQVVGPFESTVTRLDGATLSLEITSIPTIWHGRHAVQTIAIDVTERRRTESLLAYTNLHDPVSGLPNRRLLADRIDQAVRRARRTGERSALLFCDLDHFKVINDALGHTVGDQVLNAAAQRLRSLVRETDTVARFGGDELVVLTQDLTQDNDATHLADRILGAFEAPIDAAGTAIHLGVSIGIAHISGEEARDGLLSLAESAMFVAKERGRNRSVVADESLRASSGDRLRIQRDIRASLENSTGLDLHLQREVDLGTGRTLGFEGLIRWTQPGIGPVPPDRFLPIAAEAGLMHRVGGFVIGRVADALTQLPAGHDGIWIAANAAAEELEDPRFASQIESTIDDRGFDPRSLCIEITEHSIMRDPPGVARALQPLRERGVAIAIDDFGTGYSSLSYLARFQPDFLKIDRSFIADAVEQANQRAIVEGIVHLAHSLGITTVAEGIETEQQAKLLAELGCDIGQGWHFGRPGPIDQVIADHRS